MANSKELAPYMIGAQTLLGAIQGYSQLSGFRSQLRIQKIQDRINEMLAENAFRNRMEQLYTAQDEVREQASQEYLEEQKAFRTKQAQLQVFQAERGAAGQSAVDTHNQLSASHHAWRQIQLSNIQKAERALQFQKEAAIDARTAQELSSSMKSYDSLNPLMGMMAGGAQGFMGAVDKYYKFLDWANTDLDVDTSLPPGIQYSGDSPKYYTIYPDEADL